MNVNSLRAHIHKIRQFLHENQSYHLFGVAETWLDSSVPNDVVEVKGFNLLRQDRNVHGGRVALYIRNYFKTTVLAESNTEVTGKPHIPEYIMCTIQEGDSAPVFISVIYRPPKVPFINNSDFIDNLNTLCNDYSHKIILGDLNSDLRKDSDDSKFVRKLADELSLQLVQHGPTHHTSTSHTWIDVLLIDSNDTLLTSENLVANWKSKHNIINLELSLSVPVIANDSFYYRDFNNVDQVELLDCLARLNWSPLDLFTFDLETALDVLCSNLTSVIDNLAPLKHVVPRKGKLPWIGAEISRMYRLRDSIYRRYKRTGDSTLLQEFLRLRDEAASKTEEARTSFLSNKLFEALRNNNIWKELRNLGLLPKSGGG